MKRKWEWIAEVCKKKGLKESAEIAKRIDEIMIKFYDNRHTPTWKNVIPDLKNTLDEVAVVAGESLYCTACYISESCGRCKFANEAGDCSDSSGLYQRFMAAFYDEKWKTNLGR